MIKYIILTFFLFSLSMYACTQDNRPIQLLVRGDDMGSSHSANVAVIKVFKEGIERSAEVIVPSPWFPEAVTLLNENPTLDAGVHLTLTSEWENIKWRPITSCKTIIDEDGYFRPFVFKHPDYPGKSIEENGYDLSEIEAELRAQITVAKKKIRHLSHYSAHMGIDGLPGVRDIIEKLADEFSININPETYGVIQLPFAGSSKTVDAKRELVYKMISSLKPGNTYLYLDHPGLDSEELRAVFHRGYEHVAQDRSAVTELWTDPKVRGLLRRKNVMLISYRDLLQQQRAEP